MPRHVTRGAGLPVTEVIVLQPTPFCNINCTYCYLPGRDVKTVMQQSTVRVLFEKLFASGWPARELTVIWHAGEPLVVPIDFYQEAFEIIEGLRPKSIALRHSFQTNGMLISEEWCELFKQWQVGVGVSIDGPRHLNDVHRLSRKGGSTYERAIAGIRMLREQQVPFHVISVLSEPGLKAAAELLEFYVSEGIEDVCFNVEESEGEHVSGLFARSDAQLRFRAFLGEFWQLARKSGKVRFIRELDGMLPRVFRPDGTALRNVQVDPLGMVNVDCLGNVSSFSPELLGLKSADYANFVIGNIHTDSLEHIRDSAPLATMSRDIAAGVAACQESCEYFSVCGGGAPINKLAENGSFATTRTAFCSLTQMVPIDLILAAFDQVEDVDTRACGVAELPVRLAQAARND
jgi:uncharacterized protein